MVTSRDSKGRFIKGHNIKPGFGKGSKHTLEAKKKISESGIGRTLSKETINKIVKKRMDGDNYFVSEDMRKHSSEVQKGRHHSIQTEFKKGHTPATKGTRKEYIGNHGYKVNNKGILEHRYVWCSQKGNLTYIPVGMVIHHLDLNKQNNSPNNLVMIPRPDHTRLHINSRKWGINNAN